MYGAGCFSAVGWGFSAHANLKACGEIVSFGQQTTINQLFLSGSPSKVLKDHFFHLGVFISVHKHTAALYRLYQYQYGVTRLLDHTPCDSIRAK